MPPLQGAIDLGRSATQGVAPGLVTCRPGRGGHATRRRR